MGRMEGIAADATGTVTSPRRLQSDGSVTIEGVEVVPFSAVVARLRSDYPGVAVTRIESILLREWEAFTAGRPMVVPAAVEEGVREILDQR